MQTAVSSECIQRKLQTFGFTKEVADHYGANWYMYRNWVRKTEEKLISAACEGFLQSGLTSPRLIEDQKAFRQLCDSGSIRRYIVGQVMPCKTPPQLIDSLGVDPGDLAMVIVDAEGEDTSVVKALLMTGTFAPALLMFEAKWAEDLELLFLLKSHNYSIGVTHYGYRDEEENTVAVLP